MKNQTLDLKKLNVQTDLQFMNIHVNHIWTKMTPIEIFEYKMRWKPDGFSVAFHSDWDIHVKTWLKQLDKTEWIWDNWTGVYEHTCLFEDLAVAQAFTKFLDEDHPRARIKKAVFDGLPG